MKNFMATSSPAPKTDPTIEDVIRAHPFLRGLAPEHVRILASCATRMHYGKDELIFREGDPANRFYLIEQGRVSLESREGAPAALAKSVGVIEPGDVLGWSWLFSPYLWHFDARTLEPTDAIFFYGTRLREHCEQDHHFGFEMMKRMAQVMMSRLQAARRQGIAPRSGASGS